MAEYTNNAVISYREDLNDELSLFRVQPVGWELPQFIAGQYAELALPELVRAEEGGKMIRRSYSIASPPRDRKELEFYIVRVADGAFTPALFGLQEGDPLWLGPKIKGKFTLEEVPPGSDLVMIATGTGLAPFLSMIRQHHAPGATPPWDRCLIIHGARYKHDLGYSEELLALSRSTDWFKYLPALTRESDTSSWQGERGRVQTLFERRLVEEQLGNDLTVDKTHFLLCGNPQMIDDLEVMLGARGFNLHKKKAPGNIHVERYW